MKASLASALSVLLLAGCGSDASSEGAVPEDGGADGATDSGGGDSLVEPKCAAHGDMPFIWAKRVAGGATLRSFSLAADGSMIIGGGSGMSTVIGVDDPAPVTLTSKLGDQDAFVAKLTADASLVWAKSGGSTDSDTTISVSAAADGGAFAIGTFKGIATFGKGEPKETTLTAPSVNAIFIEKFAADGSLAWAKPIAGSGTSSALPIGAFAAADGSVRVYGELTGSIVFGKGEAKETTLDQGTSMTYDFYVAKYAADGSLAWAKRIAAVATPPRAAIDASGNMLVATSGGTSTIFAPGETNETKPTSSGLLFAKYDGDGKFLSVVTTSGVVGSDLVWSADGTWTITGTLFPTITAGAQTAVFGKGEPNETTFTGGLPLMFLARYSADGKLAWAKRGGEGGRVHGIHLGVAADGTTRSWGTYGASEYPVFGPGEPGAMKLPASACVGTNCNIPYLADYDANGTFAYAKRQSPDNPSAVGFEVAADGSMFIAGSFASNTQVTKFGEGEPTETKVQPLKGMGTTYVARYGHCP